MAAIAMRSQGPYQFADRMTVALCDLCNSDEIDPTTAWIFESPNWTSSEDEARERDVPWQDDPRWLACPVCTALIRSENRPALLERSIQTQVEKLRKQNRHMLPETIRYEAARAHGIFWQTLRGDGVPFTQYRRLGGP